MGNNHSSRQLSDVPLVSQSHEPVSLRDCGAAASLVLSTATKLRLEEVNKALSVFDHATGELLFRYDEQAFPEWTEKLLVDAKNTPIVMMEKKLAFVGYYTIKTPEAEASLRREICQIEAVLFDFILNMKLKLDDDASKERLLIEVDTDWRQRKGVIWLARGAMASKSRKHREELREAICNVAYRDSGYDVEVAAGVDLTIIALLCIILHETVDKPVHAYLIPGIAHS